MHWVNAYEMNQWHDNRDKQDNCCRFMDLHDSILPRFATFPALVAIHRSAVEFSKTTFSPMPTSAVMVVQTRPISMTILPASQATISFGIRRTNKERLVEKD
tara:strand:+ start:352 stop:657 length:306 start_codon:yes stop_codon:yes gene_type:complete